MYANLRKSFRESQKGIQNKNNLTILQTYETTSLKGVKEKGAALKHLCQ